MRNMYIHTHIYKYVCDKYVTFIGIHNSTCDTLVDMVPEILVVSVYPDLEHISVYIDFGVSVDLVLVLT